jgi:hypothetical protein
VITIALPSPDAVLTTGTPIDLEGAVVDTGLISSVGPLPEGRYRIELAYRSDGRGDDTPSAAVDVEVRQSEAPVADDWEPFDRFAE